MSVATAYDFDATTIDGRSQSLSAYQGRVLLVVNVASRCGYTMQYRGLEALYRKYKDRGLVVLGFPSNEFGRQEPGSDADIQAFCASTHDVTFPMFSKIRVNGSDAHPLFAFLKSERRGWLGSERVKWNFTKFLVDRRGHVLRRYGSTNTPDAIEPDIVRALAGGEEA